MTIQIPHLVSRPRGTSDLLLHMDGDDESTFVADYGKFGVPVTFSSLAGSGQPAVLPRIDTAQKKFGVSSLRCQNTGWLSLIPKGNLNLTNQNFTIELWAYLTAFNPRETCFMTTSGWMFCLFGSTSLSFYNNIGSGMRFTGESCTPTLNAWHHFAAVRSGSVIKLFYDGVQQGTGISITGTIINTVSELAIGNQPGAISEGSPFFPQHVNGWMDEVRITIGTALYTSNFTPPSAPFDL